MKLLTLLLLACRVWAVAPNTEGLYFSILSNPQNSGNDGSGHSRTLTEVGTVPFVTSPVPPTGIYFAGVFSDANYFDAPASLNTAMSGKAAGTFQHYINLNSLANEPVIWADDGTGSFVQVITTGAIKWFFNGNTTLGIITTAPGVITTGTTYHIAEVWDSTNFYIYVDNVLSVSLPYAFPSGSFTDLRIGRYTAAGGFYVDGYLNEFRISTAAFTQFPTTDVEARFKLKLDLKLKLSKLFLFMMPSMAYARLDNQFDETDNIKNDYMVRWTPTRTPTPGGAPKTPTVTPTPTVTRTLTPVVTP